MIIQLKKIISCSSEHPSYPAANLLENPSPGPWKCAQPGEMSTTVIIELPESSCITGLDIGNYRSCLVVVSASTSQDPDNWVFILNHQFMTREEAANNKFNTQVQLFTKNELNPQTTERKFDRVKFTCMQSANLKELFGLAFIILRTEDPEKSKLRIEDSESKSRFNFKEKSTEFLVNGQKNDKEKLGDRMKKIDSDNFDKYLESEDEEVRKRSLEKLKVGESDQVCGKEKYTLIPSNSNDNCNNRINNDDNHRNKRLSDVARTSGGDHLNKASTSQPDRSKFTKNKNSKCLICSINSDELCRNCKKLSVPSHDKSSPQKKAKPKEFKRKKEFSKLLDDVRFSLSGYVNPQRDEIRKKALKMGAKYIADPNTTSNKCTHLICAFKNTPKYQQLRGHVKIVSHLFIENCFDHKRRYPWRRYALSNRDKRADESEEEIEGSTSPVRPRNPYDQDTDSEINDGDY